MTSNEHAVSIYTRLLENYLQASWKEIVSTIPAEVCEYHIKCPSICVREDMHDWGAWLGGPIQRIELNVKLLTDYSWPILLEIMRHEVAHQVTEAIYGNSETPHGAHFRDICRLLGANPRASVLDPSTWTAQDDRDERGRILARIRKLLALSDSTDLHEAETALCKAREIAAKYAIDLQEADDGSGEEFAIICLGETLYRKNRVQLRLAHILHAFFEVRVLWHYSPSLFGDKVGSVMTVYGTPPRLRIAKYVYDCLVSFLDTAWTNYCREHADSARIRCRNARRDFQLGLLDGIVETLWNSTPPETSSTALVETRGRLADFFAKRNPRTSPIRGRGLMVNRLLHGDGQEIGRRFTIKPGLENEGPGGPRLLN